MLKRHRYDGRMSAQHRASPTAAPLAQTCVVVTRPDGAALVRRARSLGALALALPGMALRANPEPQVVARLRERGFDDWIFSSPAAVRFTFALVPEWRPARTARVFAVGAGTRRVLARRGIAGVTVPATSSDSEGLLAVPELAAVRGHRIALVGAPGGRGIIATTLTARGAAVVPIHVHERHPPRWTRRQLDALAAARAPLFTLLSSAEALASLVARLPGDALARLRSGTLVVSSDRLAALAGAAGFANIRVVRSAAPRDLLQGVLDACARARR